MEQDDDCSGDSLTDDERDVMAGFGVFEDDEAFVDGVKEARERMDREFGVQGEELFGR